VAALWRVVLTLPKRGAARSLINYEYAVLSDSAADAERRAVEQYRPYEGETVTVRSEAIEGGIVHSDIYRTSAPKGGK